MKKIYKEDMHDVTPAEARTWILDYYNSTIYTEYQSIDKCDFSFETVYTADSYTIYWAHANDDYGFNPENVYYYASGLSEMIVECVKDGLDIFIDEEISDELYVDDLLHELYIIVQDRIEAESETNTTENV